MSHPIRALFRRFAALSTSLCLVTAALVGCEAESDPAPVVDTSADSEDPGLRNFVEPAAAAEALAADPRFVELLHIVGQIGEQSLARQAELSPEALDGYVYEPDEPIDPELIDPIAVIDYAGIDTALVEQQLLVTEALLVDHQLLAFEPAQVEQIFVLAAETPQIQDTLAALIDQLPDDTPGQVGDEDPQDPHCRDICMLNRDAKRAAAYLALVAALGASLAAALIATPGIVVGLIIAVFSLRHFFRDMAEAQQEYWACVDECDGTTETEQECLHDSDCGAMEYCSHGVLGFGDNECKPLKAEDGLCTRAGQCVSGCCKYHPLTYLISPVCRPANKCN